MAQLVESFVFQLQTCVLCHLKYMRGYGICKHEVSCTAVSRSWSLMHYAGCTCLNREYLKRVLAEPNQDWTVCTHARESAHKHTADVMIRHWHQLSNPTAFIILLLMQVNCMAVTASLLFWCHERVIFSLYEAVHLIQNWAVIQTAKGETGCTVSDALWEKPSFTKTKTMQKLYCR